MADENARVDGLEAADRAQQQFPDAVVGRGSYQDQHWIEVKLDSLVEVCQWLRDDPGMAFDFLTDVTEDAQLLGDAFARVPAPLGRFAVFGNHDYRGRREGRLVAWLRRQGVRTLRNANVSITRGAGRLRLVGLEDIDKSSSSMFVSAPASGIVTAFDAEQFGKEVVSMIAEAAVPRGLKYVAVVPVARSVTSRVYSTLVVAAARIQKFPLMAQPSRTLTNISQFDSRKNQISPESLDPWGTIEPTPL